MVKIYRTTQQWNHWLTQTLGQRVLAAESQYLVRALAKFFGKHALLIGVPAQCELLKTCATADQFLLTSLLNRNKTIKTIEGHLTELPIASGSVDLVLLPHSLEYTDNPHQLLAESCRIVKPEGHIVILGFNPFSLWGLKKLVSRHKKNIPWSSHFVRASKIKAWLKLADFELVKQDTLLFRPPLQSAIYQKIRYLEWIGRHCYGAWGGVYVLVAKAKVIPLTPIRLRWQQKLSHAHIATLSGHSMRDYYS